jgi:hypothetical protein
MEKALFKGLLFISFLSGVVFGETTLNFNNQLFIINKIEQNISLIKNLTENILANPADSPQSRSDLVTSVFKKENLAEEISEILCQEFLQKYIQTEDKDVALKQATISKMLNICFLLKTKVDLELIKSLEVQLAEFKKPLKLNYKENPDYKPSRYRKFSSGTKCTNHDQNK